MKTLLSPQFVELYQNFIALNYKLYQFKYGQTAEGKQRLEIYNRIVETINELCEKKITNLGAVYANLSLVFPAMPIPLLEELAQNLDELASTGTFSLFQYTEILFVMATLTVNATQQMTKAMSLFKMQAGRHSRLEQLECKEQVLQIFQKIKRLEETNTAKGRASAFATVFQQELRPLLKDTDYFKEHLEDDDDFEKAYRVNNRAYKSIKKLYSTWKKNPVSKSDKILAILDKNLWQLSWNSVQKDLDMTPQTFSSFLKFTQNIDEIISSPRNNIH